MYFPAERLPVVSLSKARITNKQATIPWHKIGHKRPPTCVCGCGCVCVTPNLFIQSNSVCYATPPLYSFVRTAAMFGSSARCGLSSLSARQPDYVQLLHPYRTLQPPYACSSPCGM